MITQALLLSIALPALTAGSVLLLGWRFGRRDAEPATAWSAAPAMGLSFIVGYVTLIGWPPYPPINATQRLVYEILVGSLIMAVLVWRRAPSTLTGIVRLLFSLALPWLILRPNIEHRWSTTQDVLWVAGLGTLTFLYGVALDAAARRNRGAVAPGLALLAWTGLALVLVLSGSALLAQLAGACAAALGASMLVGLFQPRLQWAPAGTAILGWIWVGLSINAAFYAEGSPYALLLVAAAGLAGMTSRHFAPGAPVLRRLLASAGFTVVLAGAAVVLAWRT